MNVVVGGVALVPGADADVDVSAVVNGLVTRRVTLLQKESRSKLVWLCLTHRNGVYLSPY